MAKRKIGLHIRPEYQSHADLLGMMRRGDRFIVHITHNDKDTDLVTQMEVIAINKGVGGRDEWRVYFYRQAEAGLKNGLFILEFDSSLHCNNLPPEMLR